MYLEKDGMGDSCIFGSHLAPHLFHQRDSFVAPSLVVVDDKGGKSQTSRFGSHAKQVDQTKPSLNSVRSRKSRMLCPSCLLESSSTLAGLAVSGKAWDTSLSL